MIARLIAGLLAPLFRNGEPKPLKHVPKARHPCFLLPADRYRREVLGQPLVGKPSGLFIHPAPAINALLEQAEGQISLLERVFGVPYGEWQDRGGIWRIEVLRPDLGNLRMSSGAEEDAGPLWMPGGYNAYGMKEAVVDPVPNTPDRLRAVQVI